MELLKACIDRVASMGEAAMRKRPALPVPEAQLTEIEVQDGRRLEWEQHYGPKSPVKNEKATVVIPKESYGPEGRNVHIIVELQHHPLGVDSVHFYKPNQEGVFGLEPAIWVVRKQHNVAKDEMAVQPNLSQIQSALEAAGYKVQHVKANPGYTHSANIYREKDHVGSLDLNDLLSGKGHKKIDYGYCLTLRVEHSKQIVEALFKLLEQKSLPA